MLVDIDQIVNLLVKNINVGQKIVVLLLTFDECVLNLKNICKSGCFFNSVEGLIDNFHVSLVIINQFDFLFVVDY